MADQSGDPNIATVNVRYRLIPDNNADQQLLTDLQGAEGQRQSAQAAARDAQQAGLDNNKFINRLIKGLNLDPAMSPDNKNTDERNQAIVKFLSEQFGKIADVMTKGISMPLGLVEDIYKEMKKNSPLLQTLESLFNLAMQLFFMPLGNKLAEVLLPAVINLVETAAKMWDELGDGNLSQIFAKAIEWGVSAIAKFFTDVGGTLKSQGGLLGSIGKMMESIGKFIKGGLFNVIKLIFDAAGFVMEHLKSIIAAIVTFKAASLMTSVLTARAIITGTQSVNGTTVGALAGLALLTGVAAYGALASQGFADGGVVKHTPGGRLITVAENEDEVIMPRSKAGMGGNVTNNFYGYTSDDIRDMIDRSVSEKISLSYIKGGY